MGLHSILWIVLFSWVLSSWKGQCEDSRVSVNFLKAPHALSRSNSATFVFQVLVGGNGDICPTCTVKCKLDDWVPSDCEARVVYYNGLQDGDHTFEVCTNGSGVFGCANYNWTIDTVPPTAYVTASSSFTNALNVSVNITFSEPCTVGGGFGCSSVNACNLVVYGDGQVMPSTLNIIQPNLIYSLLVALSPSVQFGRVILVMAKNFCSDSAGNKFTRSTNSSFYVHFDRRSVFVDLRIHIPEKLLQLNNETRTVLATNSYEKLKFFLYFSEPVLNSSAEILNSLKTSRGLLLPISGQSFGDRRFGFLVENISSVAIVTISLDSHSIISRQGTPISPVTPVTFLYDSQRPAVRLSTRSNMRTRDRSIPISIKFRKPVFGFNSSHILVSGGHFQSFREMSRSIYVVEIQADANFISVSVPENITGDVAGNKNLPSNILQVRHYSVPIISSIISIFAAASFGVTSFAAGFLTVSIASLQSVGAFSGPSSLTSDPARSLFRIVCYIQVFALSRWFAVTFPVEYYEFARGLQWSIPYFNLPWESGHVQPIIVGSNSPAGSQLYLSKIHKSGLYTSIHPEEENPVKAASMYGLPLTPMEYQSFFESQHIKPQAQYLSDLQNSNGWRQFNRSMFWLAVIGGSLILLHLFLLVFLKLRNKSFEKQMDCKALKFPRFEIFLVIIALPCICEASAALIKGGEPSGVVVGVLLLGVAFFLLLALLLFVSVGITCCKLLLYKEVHQEGLEFHWYQEIVRVTLGPGKRGQWTWKNEKKSVRLVMFGPLFEDLRGPPKYMLSQISGGNTRKQGQGDRIIASDDETEDAEAPFLQKLFGILRIYYVLIESVKRVALGILAGAYSENLSSRTPAITLLSITSFQLFFLVLKKPFINKKVQLVEIISVSSQAGLFATCFILLEKEFSDRAQTKLGFFMLGLFLVGFVTQMISEWFALFKQTMQLDPAEKSFVSGFKTALIGFFLLFIPHKMIKILESWIPKNQPGDVEAVLSFDRYRSSSGSKSSGSTEKPWLKQLREMAKASFNKEQSGTATDPSTSRAGEANDPSTSRAGWSGFWSSKGSGSSSASKSTDSKSKPKGLYKDLEAVFASK